MDPDDTGSILLFRMTKFWLFFGIKTIIFPYNQYVRKFLLALAFLLAIVFLLGSFSQFQKILLILQSGHWAFIALGIVAAFMLLFCMAATYQQIYRVVGLEESLVRLFYVSTAAFFVNIVTPATVGVPALAVYLADGHRRGHSMGKVMAAWAINLFFDYLGLLAVATLGMAVLVRRNNLHAAEMTAFTILMAGATGLGVLLYLGMHSSVVLGKVLTWAARGINRVMRIFIHRDYLDENRAVSFAFDIGEGMVALRSHPKMLARPLLLALLNKTLLLLILLIMFLAFNVPFTAGTLIGGFSIGYLFVIVSPTPLGIGIVEGVMALALRSLGVALEAATVVTLSFRGLTFWLPFFIGLLTFRRVSGKAR
jgi:glycosyltransferase 2 family protein